MIEKNLLKFLYYPIVKSILTMSKLKKVKILTKSKIHSNYRQENNTYDSIFKNQKISVIYCNIIIIISIEDFNRISLKKNKSYLNKSFLIE